MTYRLNFVKLTCVHPGADTFTGDDTTLRFKGGGFDGSKKGFYPDGTPAGGFGVIFNTNSANPGFAYTGHPVNAGDIGFLVENNVGSELLPATFKGPLTIIAADEDGFEFFQDGFAFEPDFMGSTTFTTCLRSFSTPFIPTRFRHLTKLLR